MSNKFKISSDGIDLLKHFEGLRLHAYLCSAGVATIGYGSTMHKGKPVRLGMVWTKAQAEQALLDDLIVFEKSVNKLVKVSINQKMFDALVCFVYNVGAGAFEKSTLLKKLNAKEYSEVPDQFLRWDKANGKSVRGLTLRRKAESDLFTKGLEHLDNTKGEDND